MVLTIVFRARIFMLARKKTSDTENAGKNFPSEWIEGLNRILNKTYKTECLKEKRYFDVYGHIYEEELLLIVSYLSEKDELTTPITLFLSQDLPPVKNSSPLEESEEKLKKSHDFLIDMVGLFFDDIFADPEKEFFSPHWEVLNHENLAVYYKISRENIALTLEANKLLGES